HTVRIAGSTAHSDLPSFPTRRSSDLLLDRQRHALQRDLLLEHVRATRLRRGDLERAGLRVLEGEPLHGLAGLLRREHRDDDVTTDRKSTRLNSSHDQISYAAFCLKKK